MFRRSGIKVQAFVPLTWPNGAWLPLTLWTWWNEQIGEMMEVLKGAQGPWLFRSEHFVSVTWTVVNDEQFDKLADLFRRTARAFGMEDLYFDYCDVTFSVAHSNGDEPI